MKKSRMYKYLVLIIIVLSIGIGYAFLTVDLKINGTVGINDSRWNVHFANYQQTANSTITPTSGNAPVITGDTTTEISYNVTFNEPGDVYEFTVDIVNGGTMDATITSLETDLKIGDSVVSTIPNYLSYNLAYSNGDEFSTPHGLAAGASEKILVRVEFNQNILINQYEDAAGRTFHFDVKPIYVQDSYTEQEENYQYVYTNAHEYFYVNQEISEGINIYDNYQDVGTDVFLRHAMRNGYIAKTDLGYIKAGNVYYISTFIPNDYDEFDETMATLLSIADLNGTCEYEPGVFFNCGPLYAYINTGVSITAGGAKCYINDSFSYCD